MTTKKKVIIVTVSVVILGLGAYLLTKPDKNGKSILGGKGKKFIDEGDVNLIPAFSASQKSSLLYEAMNRYGKADRTLIFETLTDVTQAQFGLINKAFGLKNYNSILGYNTYGGSKVPLKTWLKDQLSADDYKLLRNKFPLYL